MDVSDTEMPTPSASSTTPVMEAHTWKVAKNDNDNDNESSSTAAAAAAAAISTSPPSSVIGNNTCHVLPCNIDFTGMAPSHLYFHPQPLLPPPSSQAGNESSSSSSVQMYASTFRGRGLLAKHQEIENNGNDDSDYQHKAQPLLLQVGEDHDGNGSSSNHQPILKVKATIDHMMEWHHQHNPAAAAAAVDNYHDDQSRWQRAEAWMEVSHAVRCVELRCTGVVVG